MSELFRKIHPFELCGMKAWAGVPDDRANAVIIIGDAIISVSKARVLRDWLTAALPCEHKGARSGVMKWGEPTEMTCHECGEKVPSFTKFNV